MLAKFKPKTFAISRGFLATARLSCRWILALWQVKKVSRIYDTTIWQPYLASYLFFTMHSTVCTVIDLFMCVCHIFLINYYYYIYAGGLFAAWAGRFNAGNLSRLLVTKVTQCGKLLYITQSH